MWLKDLFNVFSEDSLLDEAFKQSDEMLSITYEMFSESKRSLREKDINKLETDIYAKDIEVNKFERDVRRKVLKHISVCGTEGINSALVLISIIIDIERIGDYTKNVLELAENHPSRLSGGAFSEDLKKVEAAVEDSFIRVPKLFQASDVEDAEKLLTEYMWVSKVCTQRGNDYIKGVDTSISSADAVTLALYYRYLKRISSHLRNIATSVINPFDQIGFTHNILNKNNDSESEK